MPYFLTHSRRIKHGVEVNIGIASPPLLSPPEASENRPPLEGDEGGGSEGGSDSGVIVDSGGGSGHLENQPPLGGDGGGESGVDVDLILALLLMVEGGGGSDEHPENHLWRDGGGGNESWKVMGGVDDYIDWEAFTEKSSRRYGSSRQLPSTSQEELQRKVAEVSTNCRRCSVC
ncbi:hypothetical protein FNV43_RR22851 [Rhamnella rubrinervis]|uniref:Uncharacterized protein n=1 Tax=Rhamnella rubrinervis TaxID=2594499 RepID=A0A8K0GRI0_9ROSA|nr:hypothetical protein FNV43_RR22851 [Rhamnella rubrinervis]